ncbi:MAG: C40 family peptidase [Bacteroidota bacterium]
MFLIVFVFINGCKSKKQSQSNTNVKGQTKQSNLNPTKLTIVQEKLNIDRLEVEKSKLYSFITEWYGTPYKYGGCDKNGTDCSCFTHLLFKQVYNRTIERSSGDIYKACDKIKRSHLKEGDLVFFVTNGKGISHVGVFLKDEKFVHASTSKGVMISSLTEAYFEKTFYGAGRHN